MPSRPRITIQSRLTSIGKVFLTLIILFYAASITSQSGLLLLFIGLIGGCIAANWFYSRRMLQGLEIEAPKETFISEGARADRNWRISNRGKRVVEQLEVASAAGTLFKLPFLISQTAISLLPELVYQRRGVYPNGSVRLMTSAPFGLVRSTAWLSLPGEVVVYPRLYDTPVPPVSGLDMMSGGKLSGSRRVAHGAHFSGVRAWQAGDPIKQIHWKSTANRQELMVKTFDEELSGRLALILSCVGAEPAKVEDCVRAAGSLMFAALDAGHQIEFWDAAQDDFQKLPPFSDGGELLHLLARFEPQPLHPEAVSTKISPKAALALVAASFGPAEERLASSIGAKGRKVSFYLPSGSGSPPAGETWWFDATKIVPASSGAAAPA